MYDLIIVGGSAAGAAAGVYAARRQLKFLVIAKDLGGEVALSGEIENWLGIKHTTGIDLSSQFAEHLRSYKPEMLEGYIATKIEKKSDGTFAVTTDDGKVYESKAVVLAAGAHSRELGVPGEKEFRLKGISYCTVCDGPLFTGKTTAVIGGGNSALEAALMLADLCPQVYVINKNAQFKGEQVLIESLKAKKNVSIIYEAQTTDFFGEPGGFAKGLHYTDTSGASHEIEVAGSFVHIGQIPNSQMLPAEVAKDAYGYVVVGLDGATSVPGLFAAGDITTAPHKQIVIAAGMGATAALSAVQYINRL
jgi:alkyl hydroperoxide reductase subunit F